MYQRKKAYKLPEIRKKNVDGLIQQEHNCITVLEGVSGVQGTLHMLHSFSRL